ncbi:MAG TPA: bifunctional riboflavin kinase/FAD synthetase [Vicinamibacterales bacterium]|nr:bifunctional riboflavin kinase/FAD synthetase [Vicinamibacterales bacterium]
MKIARFPGSPRPRWPAPVVALGNFDGLHRGHLKLAEQVRRRAGERGGTPAAMIFEPHPPKVLRPDKAPPLLMTFEQKIEAFERAGLQGVAVVEFTEALSRWEPEVFVETVLVDWLRVAEVWVGANFLFGRDRSGTFTLLKALGDDRGFRVEKIDPVLYKDFVVSSTRIRHLLTEGRVDEAGALLGHHYFIDGTVVRGDGRGVALGCPTANLETENELLPAHGIYATLALVDGVTYPAVTSLGVRPTIGDNRLTVETHLLDGGRDLYGQRMRVAFVKWLREERRYDGLEPLREQIALDCAEARRLHDRLAV